MLTDADIEKLKAVFATKDDLNRFATKDDLVAMEKRFDAKFANKEDLKKFATKDDLKQMKKEIIDDIADMIENKIVKILNEHELRLDRLEKRVGGFPPIA